MKKTSLLFTALLVAAPFLSQAATQQEIDLALAPVKTNADLQLLLNSASPLDALEQHVFQFVSSVKFSKKGQQISFDKELLETNLSATEIYKILALFGQQSSISQYQNALIVTDTDKLLLTGSSLPFCNAADPIETSVTLDKNKQAIFGYAQSGIVCDGNVELTENTTITYVLVQGKKSPKGLRLTGAGFTNPFDGHIEKVTVSHDGQSIQLENNIENSGVSKYQFILESEENDLLLVSPDPQIINKDDKPPM